MLFENNYTTLSFSHTIVGSCIFNLGSKCSTLGSICWFDKTLVSYKVWGCAYFTFSHAHLLLMRLSLSTCSKVLESVCCVSSLYTFFLCRLLYHIVHRYHSNHLKFQDHQYNLQHTHTHDTHYLIIYSFTTQDSYIDYSLLSACA